MIVLVLDRGPAAAGDLYGGCARFFHSHFRGSKREYRGPEASPSNRKARFDKDVGTTDWEHP
jgi:hypothetical protein